MIKSFLIIFLTLSLIIPASARTVAYPLGEKDKRAIIRKILRYELSGKGMLKPGETLYLTQDNINPEWVQALLFNRFVLLTASGLEERQRNKQFDYVRLSKIEVKRAKVRISFEGPGRGVSYEYRKKRGRWVLRQVCGYFIQA